MPSRFTRRQFFIGMGMVFASLGISPAFGVGKPCWELPPTNPHWCPPPSPSPTPIPSPSPSAEPTHRHLLLLF